MNFYELFRFMNEHGGDHQKISGEIEQIRNQMEQNEKIRTERYRKAEKGDGMTDGEIKTYCDTLNQQNQNLRDRIAQLQDELENTRQQLVRVMDNNAKLSAESRRTADEQENQNRYMLSVGAIENVFSRHVQEIKEIRIVFRK